MQTNWEGAKEVANQRRTLSSVPRTSSNDSAKSVMSFLSRTSSSRGAASNRKVIAQGWTKHLEDGVVHAATPLTEKLPADLKTLLSSKGALQYMEKFVMDLKSVSKHGSNKKGYNLEEFKPLAGEYAGKFEKHGISMFFCSLPDAKRNPHQWFEFVEKEVNPTYRPNERLDLPVVCYSKEENSEQEGLERCSTASSSSLNEKLADIPESIDSTASSCSAQSDVMTSVASAVCDSEVLHDGGGNNNSDVEECTEKASEDHSRPPAVRLHKLTTGFGFGAPVLTTDCCPSAVPCNAATELCVHTIATEEEPLVEDRNVASSKLGSIWAKLVNSVDNTTIVSL